MPVILDFRSHYFASLYGSLVASSDVTKGRPLSEKDLFSSANHFEFLGKCYAGWSNKIGFPLPVELQKIILNAMGLFYPWINTLAGTIPPQSQDVVILDQVYQKLVHQIQLYRADVKSVDRIWFNIVQSYHLRKGILSWAEVISLLESLIPVMKKYHKMFYLNYWTSEESKYYEVLLKTSLTSKYQEQLHQGVKLLYNWMNCPVNSSTIVCCLNRFLGSVNSNVSSSSGFGLPGFARIHIAPGLLDQMSFIFHEIAHVLMGDPKPFIYHKEIKDLAKQMTPHLGIDESPIPFWTPTELIQHELEEILADFVAGEAFYRVNQDASYSSGYATQEPFLKPVYDRFCQFTNHLDQYGLLGVVQRALRNLSIPNFQLI